MSFRPELLPRMVQRLAALADETRIRLLLRLKEGPANVTALTAEMDVAQASVSKHLAVLRRRAWSRSIARETRPSTASATSASSRCAT